MANNEMLELASKRTFDELQEIDRYLRNIKKSIDEANASAKNFKLPSQNRAATGTNNGNTAQGNKLLLEQQRLITRYNDLLKDQAIKNTALKLAVSDLNKENKKAAQEALGVLNAYQKLSAEYNEAASNAKILGAELFRLEQAGEQNTAQFIQLSNAYEQANNQAQLLGNGLKKIDANAGQFQRNVGNYASGFNPLNNAISQLVREAPNAAQSFQIFAMSIGNNIGQLQDALRGLTATNKELLAQGKPVQSVFSQVVRSVLSLNTALYLGITVLIAYSKEIGEWVSSLFGANAELEKLRENQEKLDAAQRTGLKSTVETRTALKENLAIAKDTALTDTERQIALKKLRDEYPLYFKALTDQQILAGDTAEAEEKIIEALNKRAQANEAANVIAENDKRLIDLQEELRIESQLLETKKERAKEVAKEAVQTLRTSTREFGDVAVSGRVTAANNDVAESERRINELRKEQELITKQNITQEQNILKLRKESIGLDYEEEKSKELQQEAAVDYLVNQYELNRLELEGRIAFNKELLENEENGYADREAAAKEYSKLLGELAELDRAERIRVIEKTTDDEIAELRRRAKEGEITWQNANRNIYALNKQRDIDILTASEQFSQDVIGYNKEIEESYKGIYDTLPEQQRQRLETEQQIANLREMSQILNGVSGGTSIGGFVEIENQMRRIANLEQDQQLESLRLQRQEIDAEIEKIQAQEKTIEGNEAIAKLQQQQLLLDKQILDIEIKRKEAIAATQEQMRRSTQEYFNQFSGGFFDDLGLSALGSMFDQVEYEVVNSLGEIEKRTGSTFQKMYDQAQTTGEKMKVVFLQMSELAQQAFNALQDNSRARYENDLAEIDMQQRLAERFAQTEEARQQIQDQADQKRREARRREAQQQKEIALFNAVINTAQAVVAALPNIPLSILIGALGAAQIGLIASREIPEFKDGVRNFEGGLAVVGDGGRSEIVRTKNGELWRTPDTDTLVNLPKGSDVFKSDLDFLRNSGTLLGGMPHIIGDTHGLSEQGLERVMRNVMAGAASNHISIDKRGISAYSETQRSRNISFNNTVTFKSKTFRG